jgi:predicted amidophosphoribosyltransferase
MFMFFVLLVATVVIIIVTSSSRPRRRLGLGNRQCNACGQSNPAFAQFCRRCGQRLSD